MLKVNRSLLIGQLKRKIRLNSVAHYQGGKSGSFMKKAAVVGLVGAGAYAFGGPVIGHVFPAVVGSVFGLAWGFMKIGILAVGGLYLWKKWPLIKERFFNG